MNAKTDKKAGKCPVGPLSTWAASQARTAAKAAHTRDRGLGR